MEIQNLFQENLIDLNLSVSDKFEIFRIVANKLRNFGIIEHDEKLYQKLLSRENLMTTGIGKGFAIPHAFASEVNDTIIYFATLSKEVDFASLDQKPVKYIFLIVGPQNKEGLHLKILARVSRLINNIEFSHALEKVDKPDEFLKVIRYYEDQIKIN